MQRGKESDNTATAEREREREDKWTGLGGLRCSPLHLYLAVDGESVFANYVKPSTIFVNK